MDVSEPTDREPLGHEPWLTPGVRGIGAASFFADVGHEIPTALLPELVTRTLGGSAAILGVIEGASDGLAGATRFAGGALADDPERRRRTAVGGYASTAVLSGLIGVATNTAQVAVLRAGAWAARGLRVPARNALLADVVSRAAYGRAYGFERAMDNLGAIVGPLLALGLIAITDVRTAILLSIIPSLVAVAAILYAIRRTAVARKAERRPLRIVVRPVLQGPLRRLFLGISLFEIGNLAATLLILRATDVLSDDLGSDAAAKAAIALYVLYNIAATLISVPGGPRSTAPDQPGSSQPGSPPSASHTSSSPSPERASSCSHSRSSPPASASDASRPPNTQPSPPSPQTTSAAPPSAYSLPPKASAT